MKLGIIARADNGGLGTMLTEAVRHLGPHGVLLVDLGINGRGATDRARIDPWCERVWVANEHFSHHYAFPTSADEFFAECDVIYTAETPYDRRTWQLARGYGATVVLHAMPELLADREVEAAPHLLLPTPWLAESVAARRLAARQRPPELMPVPVAFDRFEPRARRRNKAETFFVHGGEAFHDRNGLELVMAAAALVDRPCKLLVMGGPWPTGDVRWEVGKVSVEWREAVGDYWEAIPLEADVMLMPRRYGGLTLPVQEAAAQGVPTVMSNLSPQTDWIADDLRVPMLSSYPVEMKGGMVDVWQTDPSYLADIWNDLLDSPERVKLASTHARLWAEGLSWDRWAPAYHRYFEAVTDGR